jgi:AraC-like DNA-binding protein
VTSDPQPETRVRLSLGDVPRRDRAAVYREVFGRKVVGLDVSAVPGAPFMADLTLRSMPGLQIVSGWAGASVNRRTRELMADGQDGFGLAIVTKGLCKVSQRGREVDQTGPRTCLISFSEESTAVAVEPCEILCLQIPRQALDGRVRHLDDLVSKPLSGDAPPLRLLRSYLGLLLDETLPLEGALRTTAVTHLHDLVALAIGATEEAWEKGLARSVAAAKLHGIKRDIREHCARPDFSVGEVATRWGVSPRQIQRLFEAEGETFSEFTQKVRLENAHASLRDTGLANRKIASIAMDCGFGDISHFNRAFRRVYGLSPSDVRSGSGVSAEPRSRFTTRLNPSPNTRK